MSATAQRSEPANRTGVTVRPSARRAISQATRRLSRAPVVVIVAFAIVILAALTALLGGLVFPHATGQDIMASLDPIGTASHPLGTDELGRDVLQMAVAGAASALAGPVVIAMGSAAIGLFFGTIAGYRGGIADTFIARWSDLLLSLPVVLVAIVVVGITGGGYWPTVILLMILFTPSDIRLVRSAVMEQTARPYVEAARVLGLRPRRIAVVHIIPNVIPIEAANLLLNIAFALVSLSALSFLGLGVAPGSANWGQQLADGQSIMAQNPAAVWTPALLIIVVACSINVVGEWLSGRLGGRGEAL
jgi:peptide/nickel transport system permease protein